MSISISPLKIFYLIQSSLLASPKPPNPNDSINFSDPFLIASIFFAFYNPIAWNVIGRIEYRTRSITKICGGNGHLACYLFAAYIFTIGIARDIV